MFKIFLLLLSLAYPYFLHAAPVDNVKWKVVKFVGEPWYTKPNKVIGKYQIWEPYSPTEGIFYNCPTQSNVNASESKTYNTYSLDEFITNKEFKRFKKYQKELRLPNTKYYVQRITCEGADKYRSVLYPFVTPYRSGFAYYPFEGGIYILQAEKN